ncbi:hypothetical protein CCACVL1_28480 [Corchorus capsularis]|uniref:Uncharacterized protein n=1 Tax=Corchorus capsularis TaxID=210143 RepID=A0A1R3G6D7_COCAP|nr:hypothetical protein CCACVL1_28480 [Corchorus capsularis]
MAEPAAANHRVTAGTTITSMFSYLANSQSEFR